MQKQFVKLLKPIIHIKMINFDKIKNNVIQELALPSIPNDIEELINQLTLECLDNYNLIKEIKKVDTKILKSYLPNTDNIWKTLSGCDAVYIGLISLGQKSQKYLDSISDKGSFETYLVDLIYNLILNECFSQVWCNLQDNLQDNYGLTPVIAPGEKDFSIVLQKLIFEFVSSPEVVLDYKTFFMTPLKSITFMIGVGKDILSYNIEQRCHDCHNLKCHQKLVEIKINNVIYRVPYQKRLYDVLVDNKIFFDSFCGGNHRCSRCKVTVVKNNKTETKLACDTYCSHGLEVITNSEINKIEIEDTYQGFIHKGAITNDDSYGIVFDVGTTTIVGGIYHLGSKEELQVVAEHNEQYLYGLDVISRISYTLTNKSGLEQLNKSIINQLNSIIKKLTNSILGYVSKIVIVGNPTMISIINNISLTSLASYPFESQVNRFIEVESQKIGLFSNAVVTFISGISGFVGSDVLSDIVASKFYEADNYQLLIDLGTNGEIALGNKDEIYTCSTAAGPAFEGAKISCGVPSIPGAISKFSLENGNYNYTTIKNKPSIGFCGSGIVDLVATLLDNNIIDQSGMFINSDDFHINLDNNSFIFNQQDVRELQLAKSAIRTGVEILLRKAKISTAQIESVFISGGLGSNINVKSAIKIGLLPNSTESKVKLIGNSSYYGASLYLLYAKYKELFIKTQSIIKSIDLNNEEEFIDLFVNYLALGII